MANTINRVTCGVTASFACLLWLLAADAAPACGGGGKVWDVGSTISVTITSPANNTTVAAGSNVSCSATANDSDHWVEGGNSGNDNDGIASYTWSATGGTFPNGNTGSSVTWKAPDSAADVTITCTVNDVGVVTPPDQGTRDDQPGSASIGVRVEVKVWDVGSAISVTITAPANNSPVAGDADIACSASASDSDHWTVGENSGNENDGIASYTWTASAGTFPSGNTGATVTWTAPDTYGEVTITCTADDVPKTITPPDTGNRNDQPGSANVGVVVFVVTQSGTLWRFNGASPENYAIEVTWTAQGSTSGSFEWTVTEGFDKAGLVDGGNLVQYVQRNNNNTVNLHSKAPSAAEDDVHIQFKWNGIEVDTYSTTVYSPASLAFLRIEDDAFQDGYKSYIHYSILDHFGDVLPSDVPVNEVWTTAQVSDWQGENWPQPDETSNTWNPAGFYDTIGAWSIGGGGVPTPQNPQDPLGASKVQHWGQRFCVGSLTIGQGTPVQNDVLQMYRDHGRHE